jgi:hypothetical protein
MSADSVAASTQYFDDIGGNDPPCIVMVICQSPGFLWGHKSE